MLSLEPEVPVNVDLVARWPAAGKGGGPIDGRLPALGRDLDVVVVGWPDMEGVDVRGVEVPEEAFDPSCFVGDLTGD